MDDYTTECRVFLRDRVPHTMADGRKIMAKIIDSQHVRVVIKRPNQPDRVDNPPENPDNMGDGQAGGAG